MDWTREGVPQLQINFCLCDPHIFTEKTRILIKKYLLKCHFRSLLIQFYNCLILLYKFREYDRRLLQTEPFLPEVITCICSHFRVCLRRPIFLVLHTKLYYFAPCLSICLIRVIVRGYFLSFSSSNFPM
jgi:hypothetical protein